MRSKIQGGSANVSTTVNGKSGNMRVEEKQTKGSGESTTIKKDIFVQTGTWKGSVCDSL